jgi:hypothetical protein
MENHKLRGEVGNTAEVQLLSAWALLATEAAGRWHACDQGKLCWRTMRCRRSFQLSFTNVFCSDGESSPLCSSSWASDELSEWCAKTELAGARCSGTSMIVKTSNDCG